MEDSKDNDKEENEEEENDLNKQLLIGEEENNKSSKTLSRSQISQELAIENLPEHSNNYDKSIKVIILGDSYVGKSSIVNCLQQDTTLQRKTISLEYYNYIIKINNFILRMQIWDTVGQEKFDSITANYYKTTDVVIFVYAINDIESFNNIEHWDNELNDKGKEKLNNDDESNTKSMYKVLVGNKKDLEKERKVTYEQGIKLCQEKNFDAFEEITCNFYKEGFLSESSSYSSKDHKIVEDNKEYKNNNDNKDTIDEHEHDNKNNDNKNNDNKDKDDKAYKDNNKNNEEDEACVKNLFEKIAKYFYKKHIKEMTNRENSSVYNYEASTSMLEIKEENKEKDDKSCCC